MYANAQMITGIWKRVKNAVTVAIEHSWCCGGLKRCRQRTTGDQLSAAVARTLITIIIMIMYNVFCLLALRWWAKILILITVNRCCCCYCCCCCCHCCCCCCCILQRLTDCCIIEQVYLYIAFFRCHLHGNRKSLLLRHSPFHLIRFYPRDAMLARVFATATCPSVCPSVRLSHAGIVPSRAKAGSWNVHHLIAPWL